ncbi:MAG: hypothetical protein E6I93_07620 [Chloroflexi bacterium]|nr:MAG: hypothetical protein E6I93_07620 [Chloroflexota bacterium]
MSKRIGQDDYDRHAEQAYPECHWQAHQAHSRLFRTWTVNSSACQRRPYTLFLRTTLDLPQDESWR